MGAIDNSNMLNYRSDNGTVGFTPNVTYAWDKDSQEVDVTDDSDFPSGVALKKVIVKVHDKFGNHVEDYIMPPDDSDSGHAGDVTIDVSDLDVSKGLNITATVIADDGKLVADGGVYNIGTSGSLSSWDKQKNA